MAQVDINDDKYDELYCVHDLMNDIGQLRPLGEGLVTGDNAGVWKGEQEGIHQTCIKTFGWDAMKLNLARSVANLGGMQAYVLEEFEIETSDDDYEPEHYAALFKIAPLMSQDDKAFMQANDEPLENEGFEDRFSKAVGKAGGLDENSFYLGYAIHIVRAAVAEQEIVAKWNNYVAGKPASAGQLLRDPKRTYFLYSEPVLKEQNCVADAMSQGQAGLSAEIVRDYIGIERSQTAPVRFMEIAEPCQKKYGWDQRKFDIAKMIAVQRMTISYMDAEITKQGGKPDEFRSAWLELKSADRIRLGQPEWSSDKALIANMETVIQKAVDKTGYRGDRKTVGHLFESLSLGNDARGRWPGFPRRGLN